MKHVTHAMSYSAEEGRRQVLPLLLACGHTYCSGCLTMMGKKQKHTRHIMCPECKVSTVTVLCLAPFQPFQWMKARIGQSIKNGRWNFEYSPWRVLCTSDEGWSLQYNARRMTGCTLEMRVLLGYGWS